MIVGVIGAGQMGAGIAQVSAGAGHDVLLADIDIARAEAGKAGIAKALGRLVAKEKIAGADADALLARITPVADHAAFAPTDLVIEAATEREEIKRAIFASVGQHLSPVMGLIELIRGLATSDDTLATVEGFGRGLGKEIVHANDAPGFIVNRVLMPLINEAVFALGEGVATMQDIDAGCRLGLNHPMGPITLADFIGLDTCLEIIRVLQSGTGDPKFRPAPLLVQYVEAGWVGKKAGRGFYDWTGPEPVPTR